MEQTNNFDEYDELSQLSQEANYDSDSESNDWSGYETDYAWLQDNINTDTTKKPLIKWKSK